MGECTSRFGFFYLGSDKENVKGLTKWQAEHIYQLTPIPPGMEDSLQNIEKSKRIDKEKQKEIQKQNEVIADEYIVRAVQEKNLREIAVLTGCGTEKGGQLAYQAALDCLIHQLAEDEVCRIMNLKQKAMTHRKKKIAAATYLYQADCDGEWGEIYIDFVNKKTKIIRLAGWDLTRSRVYARTAIRYLISTEGRDLPKKRRIIFEPQRPPRRQHKHKFDANPPYR